MPDILLQNGDLVIGKNSDISMCYDIADDIIQTANNNIMMRFGDNRYHKEFGNKLFISRVKYNKAGIDMVATECENAIISGDSRIKDVQVSVTAEDNGMCAIDYILHYISEVEEEIWDEDIDDEFFDESDYYDTVDDNGEEELMSASGRLYINAFNIRR